MDYLQKYKCWRYNTNVSVYEMLRMAFLFMKILILLFASVLFYTACQQSNLDNGIIVKDKMVNVLLDMQLADASLNQVNNNDSMKMYAHSRYNYIFNKYKIDSTIFTNSLKFYAKDPVELDSMYSIVSDSLLSLEKEIQAIQEQLNNTEIYNLYGYVFKKFAGPSKINSMNYYRLDVKELYNSYIENAPDSIRNLRDSLRRQPIIKKSKNNDN